MDYIYANVGNLVLRLPVGELDNLGMADAATYFGEGDPDDLPDDAWVPLLDMSGVLLATVLRRCEYEIAFAADQHQRERKEYLS